MTSKPDLHYTDFYTWSQDQADLLRKMPITFDGLDIVNIADEIEGLGRHEVSRSSSLLMQVIDCLLKLAANPDSDEAVSWVSDASIFQSEVLLTCSPGARKRLDLDKIWKLATRRSSISPLPDECPWSLDQLLDEDFSPRQMASTRFSGR